MKKENIKKTSAYTAIILSSIFATVWAYWGIIENFHEGWYYRSFSMNLLLFFRQYYTFTLIFMLLPLFAIFYRRTGGLLLIATGILVPVMWVRSSAAIVIFSLPLIITGILFLSGTISNVRRSIMILLIPPLAATIAFGIEPAVRVSHRTDDGFTGARKVRSNQAELLWAPAGPGWPQNASELTYTSWEDVKTICAHLSEDGKTLQDTVVGLWRLPEIEEVVSSLTRNGKNAGGHWDNNRREATYKHKPDKESPLWNPHSPIIYWWTATEADSTHAYRIVYNGSFQPANKTLKMGSLGFRAVRDIK